MFEWDEAKNQANIAKHGVSFERAKLIFEGPVLTSIDSLKVYGEIREISVGQVEELLILTVLHTSRVRRVRIISAQPAKRHERLRYEETIRSRTLN